MSITITDIAREAGVSIATVSLSLKGDPRISAPTRKRVKAVAKKLGYTPMVAFAALGRRRARRASEHSAVNVAVLSSPLWNLRADDLVAGTLKEQLARLGFRMGIIDPRELGQNPPRVLSARGYSVVIMHNVESRSPLLLWDWRKFVVICCGRHGAPAPFHAVRYAYSAAASEAVERVYAAGFRRIGLAPLTHVPPISDDRDRLQGALTTYYELTGGFPEVPPLRCRIGDRAAVGRWAREYRPDCVIGFNASTIGAIREAGIRVPEEMGFVGLAMTEPNLIERVSGMWEPVGLLLEAVAEFTDHYFRHSVYGRPPHPHETVIPLEWRDGESLRPA